MLPITNLLLEHRELGLVVAVLIGFAFGFVLERAGFGRADKLAAQFYLHDMTVFKVMFGAIITASLGVMVLSGLGLADLKLISESAVSYTYLWPQLVGGLLLGAGFLISGYCPGTSAVAMASGNMDALVTFGGVIIGSVIYSEAFPLLQSFHNSGEMGHLFLYDLLDIPPQVLAVLVAGMAIAMFFGAEKVEAIFTARRNGGEAPKPAPRNPRRLAFGSVGVLMIVALATLALPNTPRAAVTHKEKAFSAITPEDLARRVIDEPWNLRILDLRAREYCEKRRVPGAECVPWKEVSKLGLPYSSGARDLVLVYHNSLDRIPPAARDYPGKVFVAKGGCKAWFAFAYTPPKPPGQEATSEQHDLYRFRSALQSALTGRKAAPPPTAVKKFTPAPRKKKGGGCG